MAAVGAEDDGQELPEGKERGKGDPIASAPSAGDEQRQGNQTHGRQGQGKAEQDELLSLLRPMRKDIVEEDSSQVATPLPSAFAPAPPL